jgi:hypothetical protein
MTLPNFLGIGVPRAGTTWLHTLLAGHPEVYVPTRRKEIRFFDVYHERGLDWYEKFFCPPEDAPWYKAIGEISPQYFYCEECPGRIAAALPTAKLLVMLRHPVDRAYSNYGFVVQRGNYRGSFEEFLAARPTHLERGFYSRHLSAYLRHFDKSQILALLFEETVTDGANARQALATFLGVSADGFPSSSKRVNASSVPRFRSLSSSAVKAGRKLRRGHLEPLVDLGGRLGARRLLTKGTPLPRLDAESRRSLSEMYEGEFEELSATLQIDLGCWRR